MGSDYSLPPTPELMPRAYSENKFPVTDNIINAEDSRLRGGSPTLSEPDRLRAPDDEGSPIRSSQVRHVTWGGATTTIRATHRFSNSPSRSTLRSSIASPTSHSSPPSPRYARH